MKHTIAFSPIGLRRAGRAALAGMLALGMAGCTLLPKSEPLARYELPASAVPAMASSPLPLTVVVTAPLASQALNSDRILVMPDGNELSVYKGARWSDRMPLVLRSRMILALRESGLVQMVVPGGSGLRPDVVLSSDLSAYHVRYENGAPVVQLVLDAALLRPDTGKPLGVRRFAIEQPVDGKDVPQVVQAYGQVADTLNRQMLDWSAPLLRDYAATRASAAAQ